MIVNIPGFKQPKSCQSCPGFVLKTEQDGSYRKLNCYCAGMQVAYNMLGPKLFPYFNPKDETVKTLCQSAPLSKPNVYVNFNGDKDRLYRILAYYIFRNGIKKFLITDAYHIMDIYLGNDENYKSPRSVVDENSLIVIEMNKTELNVNRFDETFRQFLQMCELRPSCQLWLVSPYKRNSDFLKKYYEHYSYPIFNGPTFEYVNVTAKKKEASDAQE